MGIAGVVFSVFESIGDTGDAFGISFDRLGGARFKYVMPGARCSGDVVVLTCSGLSFEVGSRLERLFGDAA